MGIKDKIKIKDGNPSIKSTRQMRTQVDTTQRKTNDLARLGYKSFMTSEKI
jgi:flagellar biosynthesis protein FlhB